MSDVYCAKCGEPFDAQEVYGWDEETEYTWFVTGVGCPCCHWGVEKHRPLRAMLARLALEHGDGDLDDFAGDCSILDNPPEVAWEAPNWDAYWNDK